MTAQLPKVSARYGAPMGRTESPLGDGARNIRLFRVRINQGGYDDGGAYWGIGAPLYCAVCDEGGRRFTRADNRAKACVNLGIARSALKNPAVGNTYKTLRSLEAKGVISASGLLLRQELDSLGFGE